MKIFPKFGNRKLILGIRENDIERFFKMFNQQGLEYFKIRNDEFCIEISEPTQEQVVVSSQASNSIEVKNDVEEEDDSYYNVESPITGTFYNSPDPESSAYVSTGSTVKEGDVLCIIESMKVMNEIKSPKSGKIVKICVDNESKIQKGETLFKIEG